LRDRSLVSLPRDGRKRRATLAIAAQLALGLAEFVHYGLLGAIVI